MFGIMAAIGAAICAPRAIREAKASYDYNSWKNSPEGSRTININKEYDKVTELWATGKISLEEMSRRRKELNKKYFGE